MDDLSCFQPSSLLYTQEKMQRYRPRGFHHVRLGDKFNGGRYKVHHKLGWGGFSTVWLARDQVLNRWVSLKIVTADSPEPSRELRVLQELHEARAAQRVVQLLDAFIHERPNGRHQCLVFELLGPTVDFVANDYHMGGERPEPDTVLRITRQLLQALASIHRAGYVHGGLRALPLADISGGNVAFTARNLARLSAKSMLKIIGPPKFEKLVRLDGQPLAPGMPEQLVEAAGWAGWIDEDDEDIRIIDFGEAFAHGAEPAKLAEPGQLQVPERIFTGRFDYRVDLWRAGCTIYTLLFGSRPFGFYGDIDYLVAGMLYFVEDLPPEWKPKWEKLKRESKFKWDHIVPDRMPAKSILEETSKVQDQSLLPQQPGVRLPVSETFASDTSPDSGAAC
ncbi:hypothetical protein VTK56DRAFT_2964 [Thermocarpiscus australiensis]